MIYKEVMASLFDFNATTYYSWKKQERPIIGLIEKYFTKEDLEEFLEYGTVDKFEFLELISYQEKIIDFIKVLSNCSNEVDAFSDREVILDYFAFATYQAYERCCSPDSTKADFIEKIVQAYDTYPMKSDFSSGLLGEFLYHFQFNYPVQEGYNKVLSHLYFQDFIPLIKVSLQYSPKAINESMRFCLAYNLYRYEQHDKFDTLYQKYRIDFGSYSSSQLEYTKASQIVRENFDFEEFKNEIGQMKNFRAL